MYLDPAASLQAERPATKLAHSACGFEAPPGNLQPIPMMAIGSGTVFVSGAAFDCAGVVNDNTGDAPGHGGVTAVSCKPELGTTICCSTPESPIMPIIHLS